MKTDPTFDTVFQVLADIRRILNEKLSSLDEHFRRAELECLENIFEQQKDALAECLDGMDQQLIALSVYVEEYQRLYARLKELKEKRIPELGGTPPALPEPIAGNSLMETLAGRLEYLKSQGKIQDR